MATISKNYAGERTIETPRGEVRAEVYWDTGDPQNVGWAYRLLYADGREETGPCDADDPWQDVYDFLGLTTR